VSTNIVNRVLYVEDDPHDADLTERWLHANAPQLALEVVMTREDAMARLTGQQIPPYDLVLTDLWLPDGDGLELLTYVRERSLPLAVVIVTSTGNEGIIVAVLKAGADDYLIKREDYLERLPFTLENALYHYRARIARQSQPLKVLYAEHYNTDIDLTRRHFSQYAPHIHLDIVTSGLQALERLAQSDKANAYDVILLDYRLPGLNGLELFKEIRQTHGPDTPVVLVTGQGDEEVVLQVLKLGAASYLVKNPGYLYQLPSELENAYYCAQLIRERAALSESEARNQAMLKAIPDLMFLLSKDGVYLDCHAKDPHTPLIPQEQFLGKNMREVLPPDLADRFARSFEETLQSGGPGIIEYSLPTHGEDRYYEARIVSCERDKVLSVVRDITERKRVEEALRESEERFRQLAENIGAAFFITEGFSATSPGQVLYVSPAYEKIWGRSRASLYHGTRSWLEAIHPEDRERVQAALRGTLQAQFDEEFRIVRPSGKVRWVHDRVFPIRNEQGEIYRLAGIVEDITERKRAERALRQSEERLRLALEAGHMGAWDWDTRTNVVRWSREHFTIMGLKPFSIQPNYHTWADRIHPDDLPVAMAALGRAIEEKVEYQCEYRIIWPDGTERWVEGRGIPVHDEAGQYVKIGGLIVDITERKRAEEALRESEERYRNVVELQTDLICRYLPDTTLTFVNDAYCRYFGKTRDELIGSQFLELIPTPARETARKHIESLIENPREIVDEHKVLRPDGSIGWQQWVDHAIRGPNGKTFEFQAVGRDITERKRAEEALRDSEHQVRLFVEHTPAAVAMFDCEMRYLLTSRRWLMDYNLGDQDIVGRSHYEVFPETPERWKEIHRRCLAGGVETCEEDMFVRVNGTIDWIRWEIRPWYFASGEIGGIIMFTEVITERKQAEQARRESEKRYQTIFEKASDAIFLENKHDEILEVNQRACELFGYSREELLAMKVPDLQAPDVRGAVGSVVSRDLKRYQDTPFESLGLYRSGKRIPIEVTNTMVVDQGRTLVLSIVRDITERKQLERRRQEQIRSIAETETKQYNFARIIGRSPTIQETIQSAQKVAAGDVSPVLITGETGTGKGIIARAIHYASRRAPFAFSMIDCTSIPETLFESELFGNEQGAFTDARKSKRGRLELARGGTLFLDEISEIPINLQAKLLQVLQEGTFNRLGGREEVALNARVLAATNRDLRAEVAAGRFRADLYQRLYVVQLDIPPLREREDDIQLLAEHFITIYNKKYGKNIRRIAPQAAEILQHYAWPGNVRELEHAIERAVFFEEGDEIRQQYLRIDLDMTAPVHKVVATIATYQDTAPIIEPAPAADGTLEQMSATIIKQTVDQCGRNISKAARKLGISRSRIYRILREN
jgi:PAS domain S-box-containing protein